MVRRSGRYKRNAQSDTHIALVQSDYADNLPDSNNYSSGTVLLDTFLLSGSYTAESGNDRRTGISECRTSVDNFDIGGGERGWTAESLS